MSGFYITINNGLLEGDHRKRMGSAVWEFMWLLDKITSVNEDGIGLVLGGRPIKLREFATGIAEPNISLNLTRLEKENYITIKHAPYGLIITINKAKKIFNQKSGLTKTLNHRINENIKPPNENIKPLLYDKTVDKTVDKTLMEILLFWNSLYATNYKTLDTSRNNIAYWMKHYSLDDIKKAISQIKHSDYWNDKMTPELFFRQKNPSREPVDYIGQMLNLKIKTTIDKSGMETYGYIKRN